MYFDDSILGVRSFVSFMMSPSHLASIAGLAGIYIETLLISKRVFEARSRMGL